MTEQPTRHQITESIRDGLAMFKDAAHIGDHNGVTPTEYARRAEAAAAQLDQGAYAHPEPAPESQVGMKPNPAQGHGGQPAPMVHQGSTLDRIRAGLAQHRGAVFDDGGGTDRPQPVAATSPQKAEQ